MKGQFPGLYLEALRQACLLRLAAAEVDAAPYNLPTELEPGYASFTSWVRLNNIEWACWLLWQQELSYPDPDHRAWLKKTYDDDIVMYPGTDGGEQFLSGGVARIYGHSYHEFGPLSGAWLRQLKGCLQAKIVYGWPHGVQTNYTSVWALGA
jgi:hypothetical protein